MTRLPTRTAPRHVTASAALLALLMTLAACGGDDTDPEADEPSASASEVSDPAAPSETEVAGPAEGEEIGADELVERFVTALDDATTATITSEAGGAFALTGEGVVDFTTDPYEMQMTLSAAQMGGDFEIRLVDGVMYVRSPMGDGKFAALDLDDPANPFGTGFTDLLDPRALAEPLEEALITATYAGAETVDGEQLEHYSAELDTEEFLSAVVPEAAGQAGAAGMGPTVVYDLFFDDAGLFRRFEVDMGGAAGSIAGTYDNWGEPVTIEAPPKSQISDQPAF